MQFVGRTLEDRLVVGGLFVAHDTRGLPLSMSLTLIQYHDYVPDLYGFLKDALRAGWSYKSTVQRIREAVTDVYGLEHWQQVESRLEQIRSHL